MTTTFKSGPTAPRSTNRGKNGRRIWLISHAVALAYTWATPGSTPLTPGKKPLCPRRWDRHDA
jgi:hypothetical protein